jgi:hypothetical protein
MQTKYTYEELIAKLVRAQLLAKQLYKPQPHMNLCPASDDTGHGHCRCGVDVGNKLYTDLMDELKL